MFNKGFYPTPQDFAVEIYGDISWSRKTILEPSAGKGDLLEAIVTHQNKKYAQYNGNLNEREIERIRNSIDCIEIEPELRAILKDKKYRIVGDDFMNFHTYKQYDLILMNPPFDKGCEHLLKAIRMQSNGGAILCQLNAETLKNPYSKDRKKLLGLLEEHQASVTYHDGIYKDAERKSDVEIAVIKIDIPKQERESVLFEHLQQTEQNEEWYSKDALVSADPILSMVQRYSLECRLVASMIKDFSTLRKHCTRSFTDKSPIVSLEITHYDFKGDCSINNVIKLIREKYWQALFANPEFTKRFPSKQAEKYRLEIKKLREYDFSYYNIKSIQEELSLEIRENIESSIMEMFSRFSYKNSYGTGNAKTAHYEDGWVSNKSWKINHKIIIPREYLRTYQQMELIRDIELVLNYFAGKTADGFDKEWQDGRADFEYFTLKFYSKTIHVVFKDLDLLKRWNIYCWMKLGMLPSTYGRKSYSEMQTEEKEMIDRFETKTEYQETVNDPEKYIIGKHQFLLK